MSDQVTISRQAHERLMDTLAQYKTTKQATIDKQLLHKMGIMNKWSDSRMLTMAEESAFQSLRNSLMRVSNQQFASNANELFDSILQRIRADESLG